MNMQPRDFRKMSQPKGRQLDDLAVAEVRALLAGRPRRRDLLIEYLHLIQDAYGCLAARHLKALADDMRIAEAEVFEVASFYHHFDIVKEGDHAPAAITVRVCDSVACMMAGAESLLARLEGLVDPAQRWPNGPTTLSSSAAAPRLPPRWSGAMPSTMPRRKASPLPPMPARSLLSSRPTASLRPTGPMAATGCSRRCWKARSRRMT